MQRLLSYRTYIAIGLSALLIGLVALLRPPDDGSETRARAGIDRYWLIKAKNPNKYNIIVLGDSRIYRGISPYTLEEQLQGMKAFNLGFSSGGLNKEMFKAAEKMLDKDSPHKILLLGVTPWALTDESAQNVLFRQESHRPWSAVVERIYLYDYIVDFYPYEFVTALKNRAKSKVKYDSKYHDNGWVSSRKIPEDTTEALQPYQEQLEQFKTSQILTNELVDQVRQWNKEGIKVYAFRPPTTQAMQDLEQRLSGFDQEAFITAFEQAGGVWINLDRSQYHSYDGSHLNDTSAVRLTGHVATVIKHQLR
jgi:hypothetical protein